MYYVGRNFRATGSATIAAEYRCSSCDFTSPVVLRGLGEGAGHSAHMLDDEGARERAKQSARSAAEGDARDMRDFLGCATCPRCGRVDRRSLALFWGATRPDPR